MSEVHRLTMHSFRAYRGIWSIDIVKRASRTVIETTQARYRHVGHTSWNVQSRDFYHQREADKQKVIAINVMK